MATDVPKSLASALFVLVLSKDPQTLNLNRLQFLCLCATAAGTVGVSSRQQLLVLNATDGCVAWAVPFTPAASVRITSAWYCILVHAALPRFSHAVAACCGRTFTSLQHRQLQGSLYMPSAQAQSYLTPSSRALWRCAVKTSQASQAPQLVLEFKAPAVCVAAWSELPSIFQPKNGLL